MEEMNNSQTPRIEGGPDTSAKFDQNDLQEVQAGEGKHVDAELERDEPDEVSREVSYDQDNTNLEKAAEIERQESLDVTRMWYERACDQAQSYIDAHGYLYDVSYYDAEVKLDNGEVTESLVLRFSHRTGGTAKDWTMSIKMTDEYLDDQFETVIEHVILSKNFETEIDERSEGGDDGFGEQEFEELKGKDRDKTGEELALLKQTNEDINRLRTEYGLSEFIVPERAVHVIKQEHWVLNEKAIYNPRLKGIGIRETPANIVFYALATHESLHANVNNYLLPIMLTEALVEATTIEMVRNQRNATIDRDRKNANAVMWQHEDALNEYGDPLYSEETYYAYVDDVGQLRSIEFGYQLERDALQMLLKKVVERDGGVRFKDEKEVQKELLHALMADDPSMLNFINDLFGSDAMDKLQFAQSARDLLRIVAEL
ncbi:MAG: hypothetical protein KC877_04380 [Candidatus Kaiserbacteria bacterium]|nr:hypothetical protein [Candidatus Kaiserbacteria bacterium]MCB9816676.1 hypothetical protein [Candidatus Nomurabacteria bacterium]